MHQERVQSEIEPRGFALRYTGCRSRALSSPITPGLKPDSPPGRASGVGRQLAIATELPFVLVATVVVGGLVGAGIDRLLHTSPWGLLVFGALGLAAGVRDVIRRMGPGGSNAKRTGGPSDQ